MVTYIIIGITVVVSYICFNNREWFIRLALIPYFTVKRNEWYRLITHGFVHADFTHLFVNMFTFWSFGTYMEHLFRYLGYGNGGYMGLYFGGMIVASIPDLIKHHNNPNYVSIGASGAVSAVLFSSIFFDPWSKIILFSIITIPGLVLWIIYLFYCQYMNKRGSDNINHNAHFYGAVYGFIYPALLNPSLIKVFLSHF